MTQLSAEHNTFLSIKMNNDDNLRINLKNYILISIMHIYLKPKSMHAIQTVKSHTLFKCSLTLPLLIKCR